MRAVQPSSPVVYIKVLDREARVKIEIPIYVRSNRNDNRRNCARKSKGLAPDIVTGKHRLIADPPVETGRTNAGTGASELLLAALRACTSTNVC